MYGVWVCGLWIMDSFFGCCFLLVECRRGRRQRLVSAAVGLTVVVVVVVAFVRV